MTEPAIRQLSEAIERLESENAALRVQLAHVTASLEELRGLRDKWLALLNPTSAEETVEGAIRNLQQAYISERDELRRQRRDLSGDMLGGL